MTRTAQRRRLAVALLFTAAGITPVVALGVAWGGQGFTAETTIGVDGRTAPTFPAISSAPAVTQAAVPQLAPAPAAAIPAAAQPTADPTVTATATRTATATKTAEATKTEDAKPSSTVSDGPAPSPSGTQSTGN